MSEQAETKVCPLCAETIKVVARKCPFCQTRQGRWVLWHPELFPTLAALFMTGMAAVFVIWLFPEEARPGGRSFARHRNDLGVVRVAFERARQDWISGFVTNTGTHPWRVQELEVRFLDSRGNMFDVHHSSVKEPFVVEPGREHAFRAGLGTLAWTNIAAVPQVRVETASDGREPSKDD